MSLSAIGRKLSRASITVTLEPNLDHTLPSSKPIIPAPTTPRLLGTSSKQSAPVLSTICVPKIADEISIGFDPVAIIIFFVSIFFIVLIFKLKQKDVKEGMSNIPGLRHESQVHTKPKRNNQFDNFDLLKHPIKQVHLSFGVLCDQELAEKDTGQ